MREIRTSGSVGAPGGENLPGPPEHAWLPCRPTGVASIARRHFLDAASARRGGANGRARHAQRWREVDMLRIHEVAIQLVGEVMPLLKAIERCDADLASQARRAVMSTPLNISGGSDQGRQAEDAALPVCAGISARDLVGFAGGGGRELHPGTIAGAEEQVRSGDRNTASVHLPEAVKRPRILTDDRRCT